MNKGFGLESKCLKIPSKRFGFGLISAAVRACSSSGPDCMAGLSRILQMRTKVGSSALGFGGGGDGGWRRFRFRSGGMGIEKIGLAERCRRRWAAVARLRRISMMEWWLD